MAAVELAYIRTMNAARYDMCEKSPTQLQLYYRIVYVCDRCLCFHFAVVIR